MLMILNKCCILECNYLSKISYLNVITIQKFENCMIWQNILEYFPFILSEMKFLAIMQNCFKFLWTHCETILLSCHDIAKWNWNFNDSQHVIQFLKCQSNPDKNDMFEMSVKSSWNVILEVMIMSWYFQNFFQVMLLWYFIYDKMSFFENSNNVEMAFFNDFPK